MASVLQPVVNQYFDADGRPLAGGKVYSFIAGESTPQPLYTDNDLETPWSNPVILDDAGRPEGPLFMLAEPAYDIRVDDANDVVIWVARNITSCCPELEEP